MPSTILSELPRATASEQRTLLTISTGCSATAQISAIVSRQHGIRMAPIATVCRASLKDPRNMSSSEAMRRWRADSDLERRPGARDATYHSYTAGLSPGRAARQHASEALYARGAATPHNRSERGCRKCTRTAASGTAALRVASRQLVYGSENHTSHFAEGGVGMPPCCCASCALPLCALPSPRCASRVHRFCSLFPRRCHSQSPNQDTPLTHCASGVPPLSLPLVTSPLEESGRSLTHHCPPGVLCRTGRGTPLHYRSPRSTRVATREPSLRLALCAVNISMKYIRCRRSSSSSPPGRWTASAEVKHRSSIGQARSSTRGRGAGLVALPLRSKSVGRAPPRARRWPVLSLMHRIAAG